MTNKDKYLKDGVDLDEMVYDYNHTKGTLKSVFIWLRQQAKPTLTEDERIILKFIVANHKTIFRDKGGDLWTRDTNDDDWTFYQFEHLFQFIKARRRILY